MEPNWKDKTVFTGDNLYVMRGMNSESVDLIYLDPPFNSNRAYAAPIGSKAAGAAFKDTWTLSDVDLVEHNRLKEENVGLYTLIESAGQIHSKGMFSYLVMMAVRLVEMRRLLKPTGSIYLHCDPTAGHYLKLVMDAVFGQGNFRSEVTWKRTNAKGLAFKGYPNNADTLLYYTKTNQFIYNRLYRPHDPAYIEKFYRHIEPETGRRYLLDNLASPNRDRPNLTYEFLGINRVWRWTKERMQEAYDKGLVVQQRSGTVPRYKRYLDESKGIPVDTIWDDIKPIQSRSKERVGYPTQKPLALLNRIIKASSNPGDVVLDPFCGCATTMVAAEDLQRNWVGIDISPKAVDLVVSRIRDRQGLFGDITHREDIPQRTDLGEELKGKGKDEYKKTLYGLQEGYCNGCHIHFQTAFLEMDHITPRAKGGTDHAENFQLLCRPCNSLKGMKSQPEFKVLLAEKKGISTSWL